MKFRNENTNKKQTSQLAYVAYDYSFGFIPQAANSLTSLLVNDIQVVKSLDNAINKNMGWSGFDITNWNQWANTGVGVGADNEGNATININGEQSPSNNYNTQQQIDQQYLQSMDQFDKNIYLSNPYYLSRGINIDLSRLGKSIWNYTPLRLLTDANARADLGNWLKSDDSKAIAMIPPLGLGATGRTVASNMLEKLTMEEIISNPTMGRVVMTGMEDSRWAGWTKMQYVRKFSDGTQIVIHYVGKWLDGVLVAVDDFKFK